MIISLGKKKIDLCESMDENDSIDNDYQSSAKVSTDDSHPSTHKESTTSGYKVKQMIKNNIET